MPTIELIRNEPGVQNQRKETVYNLSIAEIYAMTLKPQELSKLGISQNILFNMLLSHKKLTGKKLTIAELAKFDKPIKGDWKLKIRKDLFVFICKEMGKRKISKIIEDRSIYYLDDDFFVENNFFEKDFFDLAMSHFVLRMINLSAKDLIKIGVAERLTRNIEEPYITFSLRNYVVSSIDDFQRAKRCPTKEKCEDLFLRVKDCAYNRYTCADCRMLEAEEILEKLGEFEDIGGISFGVSEYGAIY